MTDQSPTSPVAMSRIQVRLGDLGLAKENLRFHEPADDGVPQLADTLLAAGVVIPPIVRPGRKGEALFMALDGRRRRFGLILLRERGEIDDDYRIDCLLAETPAQQAAAIVLPNTEHAPVHIADVITAIGKLRKAKMDTRAISAALGYAELEIKRLGELAAVHPTVLKALREGRLTLKQVRLFARINDKKRQAEIAQTALDGYFEDYQLRHVVEGGRLTVEDVKAYADTQKSAPKAAPAAAPAAASAMKPAGPSAGTSYAGAREEQRVPMTRIRQRIAERLLEAKSSTAMLTTFNEVDLKAINDIRARYKDSFEKANGVKLGFMSFFVKAVIEALKKFPLVNASIDGNDIVYHGYYDIGIAVSSPRGLVVPILRDADQLSFAQIEKAIADFGARAKDNKLTMEDLTGGTYSITNGGIFGSMMSTPILNPPQSAILGMHGITERPVVVNGEIVIRPMMYLAQSYDHRIIDGKEAVLSLRSIKEALEDPAKMLLQL